MTIKTYGAKTKTTGVKTYGATPAKTFETAEKKAAKNALTLQLAKQLVDYHTGPQSDDAYTENKVNIVTAGNGIFRVMKTPVAIFTTQVSEGVTDIPGLADMETGTKLLIPKIPFKYWLQILSWYKDIHTQDGTEASNLFFFNKDNVAIPSMYSDNTPVNGITLDGQFIIYTPIQKNSSGLSEFGHDPMVNWLRENTAPVLEVHSHHTMDAFFSGTDDANENATMFYGVYGKIKSPNPMFKFRFVSGEFKLETSMWDLFERPVMEQEVITRMMIPGCPPVETKEIKQLDFQGPWSMVDYPTDWMGQHTPAVKTYQQAYSYTRPGAGAGTGGAYDNYDSYYGYGAYGYGSYQSADHDIPEDELCQFDGYARRTKKKSTTSTSKKKEQKTQVDVVGEYSDVSIFRTATEKERKATKAIIERVFQKGKEDMVLTHCDDWVSSSKK